MLFLIVVILLLILILMMVIFFSSITINLEYHRRPDIQKLKTNMFLFKKLQIYEKNIRLDEPEEESEEDRKKRIERQIDKGIEIVFSSVDIIKSYNSMLKSINRRVIKAIKGERAKLILAIGVDDAALTGILCGTAWMILGILRMQKDNKSLFRNVSFSVEPKYNQKVFSVDISCIFTVKIAYIMYVYKTIEKIFKIEKHRLEEGPKCTDNKKLMETG